MQNQNLIVFVQCCCCRATTKIEVLERSYNDQLVYVETLIQYCPVCNNKLDDNEIKVEQEYKNWREIWQEERDADKEMSNSIKF